MNIVNFKGGHSENTVFVLMTVIMGHLFVGGGGMGPRIAYTPVV